MTIKVTIKNEDTRDTAVIAVQYQDPVQPSEGLWDDNKTHVLLGPGQSQEFFVWASQQIHIKEV